MTIAFAPSNRVTTALRLPKALPAGADDAEQHHGHRLDVQGRVAERALAGEADQVPVDEEEVEARRVVEVLAGVVDLPGIGAFELVQLQRDFAPGPIIGGVVEILEALREQPAGGAYTPARLLGPQLVTRLPESSAMRIE